jgi:hypothetical protein
LSRRTSGEVVNATLLEVFLALTFLVLAVAWQEQVAAEASTLAAANARADAAAAERKLAELTSEPLSPKHIGKSRMALAGEVDSLGRDLSQAQTRVHDLLFQSRFPPVCPGGDRAELLKVSLRSGGVLEIDVQRDEAGLVAGQHLTMAIQDFPRLFQGVRDYSRKEGCRFRARVQDAPEITKGEYKRSMAAILTTFYPLNAYEGGSER